MLSTLSAICSTHSTNNNFQNFVKMNFDFSSISMLGLIKLLNEPSGRYLVWLLWHSAVQTSVPKIHSSITLNRFYDIHVKCQFDVWGDVAHQVNLENAQQYCYHTFIICLKLKTSCGLLQNFIVHNNWLFKM